jgi:chaperonin GroES
METKIAKPLGDRVLVKENKTKEVRKSAGGIIIPETVLAEEVKTATVVAVGDGIYTQNGVVIPMSVKVGDEIILPPFGNGHKIVIGKEEYMLYRESEILMVLSL